MDDVVVLGVETRQAAVGEHHAALDAILTEPPPNIVHRRLEQRGGGFLFVEQVKLQAARLRHQLAAPHAEAAQRRAALPVGGDELDGSAGDVAGSGRRFWQSRLPLETDKLFVAQADRHRLAAQAVGAQPGGYAFGQEVENDLGIVWRHEVAGRGGAVADRLDRRSFAGPFHRRFVPAVGEVSERLAPLAEQQDERAQVARCQVADRVDAAVLQLAARGAADVEQLADRQRPDERAEILLGDDGRGVRLFQVAAQLGEDLVERNADGNGDAELATHSPADLVGDRRP